MKGRTCRGPRGPRIDPRASRPAAWEGSLLLSCPGYLAALIEAPLDLRLVAAIDRLVIAPVLGQIRLLDPAALEGVAVLLIRAVAELLRPLVMGVAQVQRHRQRPAGAHVVAGL